jgi:negative regulator of sigma E activity
MRRAVPTQHPAAALRSRHNHMGVLLAAALIAIVGLAVAVVIFASEDDNVSAPRAEKPITQSLPVNGTKAQQYADAAAGIGTAAPHHTGEAGKRYNGDTRGIVTAPSAHLDAVKAQQYADAAAGIGTAAPHHTGEAGKRYNEDTRGIVTAPSAHLDAVKAQQYADAASGIGTASPHSTRRAGQR